MGRFGMTAATNDASVQCPPSCLVKDDKNHLRAMAGIFQLRIVLLHYCVWVDLFVVYMLPIFPGNVPGPLPLTHTASDKGVSHC